MKYEEAIKELEEIVAAIEDGNMEIDKISQQIKRAKELIDICREKLGKTEADVQNILSSIES